MKITNAFQVIDAAVRNTRIAEVLGSDLKETRTTSLHELSSRRRSASKDRVQPVSTPTQEQNDQEVSLNVHGLKRTIGNNQPYWIGDPVS